MMQDNGASGKANIPSAWIPFNINHGVRIQITPEGVEHLRRAHEARNAQYPNRPFGDFREPKVNGDGWTEMQLWVVMQEFGDAIGMGLKNPISVEIGFPVERIAQAMEARQGRDADSARDSAVRQDAPKGGS